MRNYSLYLRKLKEYSRSNGIRVVFLRRKATQKGEGYEYASFSPNSRTISIVNSISKEEKIAYIIHELGHFIDDQKGGRKADEVNISYLKYNMGECISGVDKSLIVSCEASAWDAGEVLAKNLKIPLGKWFYKNKAKSLDYYVSISIKE